MRVCVCVCVVCVCVCVSHPETEVGHQAEEVSAVRRVSRQPATEERRHTAPEVLVVVVLCACLPDAALPLALFLGARNRAAPPAPAQPVAAVEARLSWMGPALQATKRWPTKSTWTRRSKPCVRVCVCCVTGCVDILCACACLRGVASTAK